MIKVLDSNIADKIAAGEVIERPVSIVKELIENSIDAGARSIIVEIRNGGKSYIRVTDDGCGISSEELRTAFLRHATSKISSINDLDDINSLGFRGEALASIAAVSRLTVVTKTEMALAGTKLMLHGGNEISCDTVGSNVGTTMVIEDVFYNTPARRKFMGSDAREAAVIIELVEHYSICYDNIRFMLINNGNTVFTTNGDGDKLNTITTVFPSREYRNLIPINSDSNIVRGYISNPGVTKSSRKGQLFFVNGRYVSSNVIEKGIEKGYGDRVFSGYPIAILFIEVEPSSIDVNIHPGKKEINFLNKEVIISSISDAISNAMHLKETIPEANVTRFKQEHRDTASNVESTPMDIKNYLLNLDGEVHTEIDNSEIESYYNYDQPVHNVQEDVVLSKPTTSPFDFCELQFKGYIFDSYIIMQARNSIFILDQHAAHERIFYEMLMENYLNSQLIAQPILTPVVIEISSDVYNSERNWMNTLTTIGYSIADFGPNMFIIKGIPEYMRLSEAEAFARSFIENSGEFENNITVIDKLIMKSCKSAVKANEHLSDMEIAALIDNLSKCKNPFSCPHGRPTFVKITKYDIERSFKRK